MEDRLSYPLLCTNTKTRIEKSLGIRPIVYLFLFVTVHDLEYVGCNIKLLSPLDTGEDYTIET